MITGSDILLRTLLEEGVDTIFGYPGGQIMPVYDKLPDYSDRIHHILVRHEQGAVHAAQGYARAKGKPGVVTVTSGPGATNVITGVADAMIDSTPLIVICGQVSNKMLGTDAFQETDVVGLTGPVSKWNCQIRRAEDICWAVARAFFIASSGRPGPVVLDLTRDAQLGVADFRYEKCSFIRSYVPYPVAPQEQLEKLASMIDASVRPLVVFGQGVVLSGAEKELSDFLDRTDIPAASTLLGLSALASDNRHLLGMVGMHGNIAANVMTQKCDLLIAIGMRFDDRVTGNTSEYAEKATIVHIDIDRTEFGKNVGIDMGINADAKDVLTRLISLVSIGDHSDWIAVAGKCMSVEKQLVIDPETNPRDGEMNMGEVVARVADAVDGRAVIVTDVGQNQMLAARYSRFADTRSFISSGGLGTMGFGLPAAIGAKVAVPERTVCLFVGDGGFQMTMQELGTIMQEGMGVKIILLNNNRLGNVRMLQQLFYNHNYSQTRMLNPDYALISGAYSIPYRKVVRREELKAAISEMLSDAGPFILDCKVHEDGMVFPMTPPGCNVGRMMLNENEWFVYGD